MTFEVQHTDTASDARAGLITTDHGTIQTPIFMPVGTVGSVKGVHFSELRQQVQAQLHHQDIACLLRLVCHRVP